MEDPCPQEELDLALRDARLNEIRCVFKIRCEDFSNSCSACRIRKALAWVRGVDDPLKPN